MPCHGLRLCNQCVLASAAAVLGMLLPHPPVAHVLHLGLLWCVAHGHGLLARTQRSGLCTSKRVTGVTAAAAVLLLLWLFLKAALTANRMDQSCLLVLLGCGWGAAQRRPNRCGW
jgi:hypothetical protein